MRRLAFAQMTAQGGVGHGQRKEGKEEMGMGREKMGREELDMSQEERALRRLACVGRIWARKKLTQGKGYSPSREGDNFLLYNMAQATPGFWSKTNMVLMIELTEISCQAKSLYDMVVEIRSLSKPRLRQPFQLKNFVNGQISAQSKTYKSWVENFCNISLKFIQPDF